MPSAPFIKVWPTALPYQEAQAQMASHLKNMQEEGACEAIWFLEHPPVYTYGACTKEKDLHVAKTFCLEGTSIALIPTDRGGYLTFHGPGQRVVYLMLNLKARKLSAHQYLALCQQWVIETLTALGIPAFLSPTQPGAWVPQGKIASLGIRIHRGFTSHGFALNIAPDLRYFQAISPCGLQGETLTSLQAIGCPVSLEEIDRLLLLSCPFLSP